MKRLLGILIMAYAVAAPLAQAGMIATDEAAQAASERERVKAMLARPEVAAQMGKLGITAADTLARVDAMTDAEVIQLAGKLDTLPAGGAISNDQLLLIILLLVLLVLVL